MDLNKVDKAAEERDLCRLSRRLFESLFWVLVFPVFVITVDGKLAIKAEDSALLTLAFV